jgi:hypothetical protein
LELGHGLFGELAALGHGPFVVGFDHGGGDEPGDRGVVREDADDFGAALRLGVEAFDTDHNVDDHDVDLRPTPPRGTRSRPAKPGALIE